MDYILRPSIGKNFAFTTIKVLIVAGLIIGITYYLDYLVGLEIFTDILKDLAGIEINPAETVTMFVAAIAIVCGLAILVSYMGLAATEYTFKQQSFVVKEGIGGGTEIPYQNVSKIRIDNGGVAGMLNAGTIIIELTGMKPEIVKLSFIENVQENAKYIQNMVQQSSMQRYYQYQEDQRIGGILDKIDEQ